MAIISIILIPSTHHDASCILQTAALISIHIVNEKSFMYLYQVSHALKWATGKTRYLRGGEASGGGGGDG